MSVEEYIRAKYSSGGPGSARFEPDDSEVHSSHVSDCQRKRYWKHKRAHSADPSVYFELGRVFELLYGAVLAFKHDPAIGPRELKQHQPWEVAEMSTRVVQDVGVSIERPDFTITGECDWVVFEDDRTFGEVTLEADGTRVVRGGEVGGPAEYDGDVVEKVVETKTKGDLGYLSGPVAKHVYQVYPYMRALGAPGEIAYMQRDDFEERVEQLEFSEAMWTDVLARAKRHHENFGADELPPTTPLNDTECRFCPFEDECRREGGSAW